MEKKAKRFPVTVWLSREDIIDKIREELCYFQDDKVLYEFLDHCYNRGLLKRDETYTAPFLKASLFARWKTTTLVTACGELLEAAATCNKGYYKWPDVYL